MTHMPYSERPRYLEASDLDDSTVDFSTLDVHGADGRDLGNLDGFMVDSTSGRVIYAVVDSAGCIRTRHFVVPIGHARLDGEHRHLLVNVTRDAVDKFPDFHPRALRRFTDAEMRTFEQRTAIACCP